MAHTFFGGWIAIADLGVMELWRLGCLEVSFSPLIERRMALAEEGKSALRSPHLRMWQRIPAHNKADNGMTNLHGLWAIVGTMIVVANAGAPCHWALFGVGDADCQTLENDSHAPGA